MRVRLHTLGCRLNEAELEAWAQGLAAQGHRLCGPQERADLVLVNTCAVTAEALRKSGQILRRSRREDPDARLVVSGCAVSLPGPPPGLVAAADLVVPNADKDRLVAIASDRLGLAPGPVAVPGPDPGPGGETLFARSRQRAFVKVQDGCRHRCAYCVITLARGDERSRPSPDLVAQVQGLVGAGGSVHGPLRRLERENDPPAFAVAEDPEGVVYEVKIPLAAPEIVPGGLGLSPGETDRFSFEWGGTARKLLSTPATRQTPPAEAGGLEGVATPAQEFLKHPAFEIIIKIIMDPVSIQAFRL